MQVWPLANGDGIGWAGTCAAAALFLTTTLAQAAEPMADEVTEKHGLRAVEESGVSKEEGEIREGNSEFGVLLEKIRFHDAEGARLYRLKLYNDAIPHLRYAAEAGFKMAQARLAGVYANGLGDVEQDLETALAWLGVASEAPTHPKIHLQFKEIWNELPEQWKEYLEEVIEAYIEKFGSAATGIRCEVKQKMESGTDNLECRFDESNEVLQQGNDSTENSEAELVPTSEPLVPKRDSSGGSR